MPHSRSIAGGAGGSGQPAVSEPALAAVVRKAAGLAAAAHAAQTPAQAGRPNAQPDCAALAHACRIAERAGHDPHTARHAAAAIRRALGEDALEQCRRHLIWTTPGATLVAPDASGDASRQVDPAVLRGLAGLGFDLSPYYQPLLDHAFAAGDAAVLAFLFEDCALPVDPALVTRAAGLHDMLSPALAGAFAPALYRAARAEPAAYGGAARIALRAGDWKTVALLLRTGIDIAARADGYARDPRRGDMVARSGSAHGRIALQRTEATLAEMLARPAQACFYGLSGRASGSSLPSRRTRNRPRHP